MRDRDSADKSLESLLEQVRQERGLELGHYKPAFLQRRLAARMHARGCADYAAYGRLLQEPGEYRAMLDALTINMTRFFRDATTFQLIEEKLLPKLLELKAPQRRLRIWSAGCASGEEPYSLAIMLHERFGPALRGWHVELMAADVEEKALETARLGSYSTYSFQGLSPRHQAWIERHFTPGPPRQLAAGVRAMVSFQQHDLALQPPPAELDLLLCRNVLIYFERKMQDRLYGAFHQALGASGFLVLGKTDIMPMAWSQHFTPVEIREHIYSPSGKVKGEL
ncbi:MAG: protein-glutamate O-methyltransferase CheR [Thermoflexales bacterium]|nr:protein-glutamate O-methyltransferase CheR [Thermoflexales bacterium]